ncbi:MAG: hypothetical protein DDT37_01249 [Firmicutes bacterium]|nr:hypothetical protein [candidate division NPL-UPA2 bacterium]
MATTLLTHITASSAVRAVKSSLVFGAPSAANTCSAGVASSTTTLPLASSVISTISAKPPLASVPKLVTKAPSKVNALITPRVARASTTKTRSRETAIWAGRPRLPRAMPSITCSATTGVACGSGCSWAPSLGPLGVVHPSRARAKTNPVAIKARATSSSAHVLLWRLSLLTAPFSFAVAMTRLAFAAIICA